MKVEKVTDFAIFCMCLSFVSFFIYFLICFNTFYVFFPTLIPLIWGPRFATDILTSQIRETWALRRALAAQREDDGGHQWVCLR